MAWVFGSTATERSAASPSPLIITALSSEEWACVEPYTVNRPVGTPSTRAAPSVARCRAARRAVKVAVEAVSWMTPPPAPSRAKASGRPRATRSWSRTTCSSSVTAGLVAQIIPWAPMPLERRSPRTPAGEEFAGK
jgi:hypothetical protein